MAKKTTKRSSKASASRATVTAPSPSSTMRSALEDHHTAFSHIMYGLFLVAIAFAAFYTFNTIGMLSKSADSNFYPVTAILMVLWAFLFWEFGHRVHTA